LLIAPLALLTPQSWILGNLLARIPGVDPLSKLAVLTDRAPIWLAKDGLEAAVLVAATLTAGRAGGPRLRRPGRRGSSRPKDQKDGPPSPSRPYRPRRRPRASPIRRKAHEDSLIDAPSRRCRRTARGEARRSRRAGLSRMPGRTRSRGVGMGNRPPKRPIRPRLAPHPRQALCVPTGAEGPAAPQQRRSHVATRPLADAPRQGPEARPKRDGCVVRVDSRPVLRLHAPRPTPVVQALHPGRRTPTRQGSSQVGRDGPL